jgi:tetratricopeptide (TPR) repeat protein
MDIPDRNKNFYWIVGAILFVVLLALAVGFSWKFFGSQSKADYVIPGVPYIGIYDHKGKFSKLAYDKDSAVASVLEYWNPGKNDLKNIKSNLTHYAGQKDNAGVVDFINGLEGMQAEIKSLTREELKDYISVSKRTPLITFTAIDENQPIESQYYPARVLIGLKENEKKLIFQDYWLGNNYEISFDEYDKLLEKTPPTLRNLYIVIQPKDLSGKLKEIQSRNITPYPQRTEIMNKAAGMFKNYAIAVNPYYTKRFDIAEKYFSAVINDSGFTDFFPPEFKVRSFYELAEMQSGKGNLESAMKNVQKSIEMNHDLNKPFKDWPGYVWRGNASGHKGEMTIPYRVQGDIFMQKKDFAKAQENYQKALDIRPKNRMAREGLSKAQLKLKGE